MRGQVELDLNLLLFWMGVYFQMGRHFASAEGLAI